MTERGENLARLLQTAIDAARDLGTAARTGTSSSRQLDDLAGMVIQRIGAFRAALRASVVHWRTVMPELAYDGPACLAEGGGLTSDPARVTCTKCREDVDRPIEKPGA